MSLMVEAQTTIWSVDFETGYSDNDETAQDNNTPSGADWTKSGTTSNWWRVESNQVLNGTLSMNGRNLDNTVTWTSESISISGYSNVSISINLKESNCDNGGNDKIETFYNIGSGNVEFGDGNGDGDFNTATNTVTGLSGTTLTITVTMFNDGSGERSIFDDITVTGTASMGKDGPGGVGDTDGSGSMVLWLDANQGVSTSGTAVTQWSDQSGYTNHCTPPASSNRPTYNSSGTNSHPIITFDGSNDYLTASDDNSLDLTTWSIIVVGIVNTHKNYNAFVVKGTDANENYEFLTNYPSTGNFHYPVKFTDASRSTDSESGETFSNSVYGVYQLDYDQSNFEMHINGDHTETDSETKTPQTNSNSLYIGDEQSTSGRNINASLAEVIIFDSPINTAQRYIIHNAMAAKYGFSMDANSLYDEDDSGFDFDVAGIGQASDGSSHEDGQGTGIVRIHTPSGLGNSEFLIWGHDNGALSSDGVTDLPTGIESRLERQWSASEAGEVGTVTITFDLSSVPGSITTSDLRLLIDGDGTFASGATSTSGATHLGSNVYQWTGIDIDNNDHFTIGSIDFSQTPLPVELVEFSATPDPDEKVVDLFWVTSSEINNDYFTVERSTDLSTFEEVVQVTGQGTTNEETEYHETDMNPVDGVSYYRLSQTDYDGKREYFNLEKVLLDMNLLEEVQIELYPNPNSGQTMFMKIPNTESSELQVLVNNFIGTEFLIDFTVINHGDHSVIAIDMNEALAAGSYLVNVKIGDKVHTHKLIVQ
tara:strand:- start:1173 stop:3464 length:2292 start_codon:yes stop_codon:yes gene_type:complete